MQLVKQGGHYTFIFRWIANPLEWIGGLYGKALHFTGEWVGGLCGKALHFTGGWVGGLCGKALHLTGEWAVKDPL